MGSKKIKKKKAKYKKLLKGTEALKLKKKEKVCLSVETVFNNECPEIPEFQYSREESNSRFYLDDSYLNQIQIFSQVRERYFKYLQTVVSKNCSFCCEPVTEDLMERVSLNLEQYAILASIQTDVYVKSINKLINSIEKSTQDKQVYKELKAFLSDLVKNKDSQFVKTEKSQPSLKPIETYSQIPTISSTRADSDVNPNMYNWESNNDYNPILTSNSYYSYRNEYLESFNENHPEGWDNSENCTDVVCDTTYWCNDVPKTIDNVDNYKGSSLVKPQLNVSVVDNNSETVLEKLSGECPVTEGEGASKKNDPLLVSRNKLQESVEQTLNQTEIVLKQKNEEKHRAYIAQILEGDEDSINNELNFHSDSENELKENMTDSNSFNRFTKMQAVVGTEGNQKTCQVKNKPKPIILTNSKVNWANHKSQKPIVWKHERVIQQYKFAKLSIEMSDERQMKNTILYNELFGEDSDDENIFEYQEEDKYKSSCTERISSWVVKYLMPYYTQKRIGDKYVFKSLGHHISETIINRIHYPDEWTVKYFISKFFPPRKKYMTEDDILLFQLE